MAVNKSVVPPACGCGSLDPAGIPFGYFLSLRLVMAHENYENTGKKVRGRKFLTTNEHE